MSSITTRFFWGYTEELVDRADDREGNKLLLTTDNLVDEVGR